MGINRKTVGRYMQEMGIAAIYPGPNLSKRNQKEGRALDNIFTERLWRTVKYEEIYLHDYLSPREACQALTRYISFYNHERLHQALDYQTPAEVYFHKSEKEESSSYRTLFLCLDRVGYHTLIECITYC